MATNETRLDYSHQNVENLPNDVINSFKMATYLDLSNNRIRDVAFISRFKNVNSLILDHNCINCSTIFPYAPKVHTLWLNFNQISRLEVFIENMGMSFPKLKQLCMMGNEASPQCTEDTFYDYIKYRLAVIAKFPYLEYLDDRPVTPDEREESRRLFNIRTGPNLTEIAYSLLDKVFAFIDPSPVMGTGRPPREHSAQYASVI